MSGPAAELARRLADRAEAVCRHYLSNGRRSGNYWLVGDVQNTPGRSLFVRLKGPNSGRGAAGRWTDAATGQHGDLLDLIALNQGLNRFADLAREVRHFLAMPVVSKPSYNEPDRAGLLIERLLAEAVPLPGTPPKPGCTAVVSTPSMVSMRCVSTPSAGLAWAAAWKPGRP